MICFAGFWSLNFYVSQLRSFSQIDVKHHIGEHVSLIDLRLRLHMGLKVTGGYKKLLEIVFSLRYEILFVGCSVRDIDDLQEFRVGKALGRTREVENSKVERGLERESHSQPAGVRFNIDFYLTESSGSL